MKRLSASLAVLALSAAAASAATVSTGPQAVIVTIYHSDGLETSDLLHPDANPWVRNSGLAFITETREIDVPTGPSEIRFEGVASTMVPQTATVEGLPSGIIERNFDYDLLSPGSLLAKSIGQTVHLVRTDPKTGKRVEFTAIVRTGPNGAMLEIDGKLEALNCSGLPEKLVFDKTPDGLTDTPTLSVKTDAAVPGHYTVKLSYIATGLNWTADYVARVNSDGRTLDLSGWLTLANFGETGFGRIPVETVAGRLNVTGDDTPVDVNALRLATQCWPTSIDWATHRPMPPPPPSPPAAVGDRDMQMVPVTIETAVVTAERRVDPRQLGDYKLYPLPEPTDMPAHETKQVQFLSQHDVPFERVYRYTVDADGESGVGTTTLYLLFKNRADAGLGKPLPAGEIAVSEPGPRGAPIFVGQAPIKDTAVDEPFEIATGDVFSVPVKQTLTSETTSGSGDAMRHQRSYEIEAANNRSATIAFELWQALEYDAPKIVSESQPHVVDRGAAIWRLALKPGEHATLRFTIDTQY
jgi:hypothetical protein